MPDRRRILMLVDHKHRDLPALSLIGYHLIQMGYEVRYVALWQEEPVIETFDPGILILAKPVYDNERLFRFKRDDRWLVVVDTEGNPQDKKYLYRVDVPVDLYFFWNEQMLERSRKVPALQHAVLKLAGAPRTDFLHPSLRGVFPDRDVILRDLGLHVERQTVTVATSTQDAHFSTERVKQQERRRRQVLDETAEYGDIVENMRRQRELTADTIRRIAERYPDLNVAVKPHPNESIVFWRDLVESLGEQVQLCVGRPINDLLLVSDLHLANNVCSTTVEAMLSGVPTIETRTTFSDDLYDAEHLSLPEYTIMAAPDVDRPIEEVLGGEGRGDAAARDTKVRSYVERWYYRFDGRRCQTYAEEIDAFVKGQVDRPLRFVPFLLRHGLVRRYAAVAFRRALRPAKRAVLARARGTARGGDGAVPGSAGGRVDDRGRYDNRIRPGDEQAWLERFEALGVGSAATGVRG